MENDEQSKKSSAKSIVCLWNECNSSKPFRILKSNGKISNPCMCMIGSTFIVCGTDEGIIELWDLRMSSSAPSLTARSLETNVGVDLDDAIQECSPIISLSTVHDSIFASLDTRGTLELWQARIRPFNYISSTSF